MMSEPMSESGSEPEASDNLPTSTPAVKREYSPSVPSSPPQTDEAQEDVKQSPSRKRSHDEMNVDVKGVIDASTIPSGEVDAITVKSSFVKTQDSASTMANPAAHSTSSLPVQTLSDSSKMPPPSQIPLRSGQREPNGQTIKAKHSHGAAAIEQSNHSKDEAMSDEPTSSFDSEPQDEIQDFDWVDLQQRYHDQMKQHDTNEQEILQEFSSFCDVHSSLTDF